MREHEELHFLLQNIGIKTRGVARGGVWRVRHPHAHPTCQDIVSEIALLSGKMRGKGEKRKRKERKVREKKKEIKK